MTELICRVLAANGMRREMTLTMLDKLSALYNAMIAVERSVSDAQRTENKLSRYGLRGLP